MSARARVQRQQNAQRYVSEEFSQLEGELTRERGLWGPPVGSHLDKWMLDMTEGPCRTRKKMLRNDMFYVHYPYAPDGEPSSPAAASQHVRLALIVMTIIIIIVTIVMSPLKYTLRSYCASSNASSTQRVPYIAPHLKRLKRRIQRQLCPLYGARWLGTGLQMGTSLPVGER